MKVDEFLHPDQMTVDECIQEAVKDTEPEHVTSVTPSRIEVFYSWEPRRHYKVRYTCMDERAKAPDDYEWAEVPSVTTVLNVLDKSGAIGWWSFRVGLKAIIELWRNKIIPEGVSPAAYEFEQLEKLIVEHRLSPNHIKDTAADRGLSIHSAFETWCEHPEFRPNPDVYPEHEQGYMRALVAFLDDLGDVSDVESEVMVGSVEYGFAGRYDCRLTLPEAREMVVKSYPVRKPKRAEIPAGRWLLDVKTSAKVYDSHALQLAGYELASVECGYGPTDYRAVIHLQSDGQYELVQTHATGEDFLSVLSCHRTMSKSKGWT